MSSYKIFETHAHYDDEAFDEDRDVLLGSMDENGIQEVVNVCGGFLFAKVFCLEVCIVQAVHEEIQKIRTDCLGTLGLQKLYQIVVGKRQELHKDLADNTNARFLDIF